MQLKILKKNDILGFVIDFTSIIQPNPQVNIISFTKLKFFYFKESRQYLLSKREKCFKKGINKNSSKREKVLKVYFNKVFLQAGIKFSLYVLQIN